MFLSNAIECFLLLASTERRLARRTVIQYTASLQKFGEYAVAQGRPRVSDFTPNLLRAAVAAEMNTAGHATRAGNWNGGEAMGASMIAAARTMVRRLSEEFPDLPLPDLNTVRAPKIPQRIQPRLEEGEYMRLEAALRMRLLRDRVPRYLIARDMAILALLGNTGLRAAECCGIDVDDVDLDEGAVRVHGKGNKWRILSIRDPDLSVHDGGEVVRALSDFLHWRERSFGPLMARALWLTPKGNRVNENALRRMLSLLCEEAGIDGNRPPHAFRRAYFTEQYRDQPNALPVLVERMGWESEAMVKIYTRGVQVELARRIPLPLLSKKWRNDQKVLSVPRRSMPILNNGVDPPRGFKLNGRAVPNLAGRDTDTTANQTPRRRSAPQP